MDILCNRFDIGADLKKLKKLSIEKGVHRRLDDEFLSRFFIGHNFDISSALKAISNYESFVDRRSDSWLKIEKSRLEAVLNSNVIDLSDGTGLKGQKIVWIRTEHWDPLSVSADEVLTVSGLLCELAYAAADPIYSVELIIDLRNVAFKHLYALTTKFAKRMIFFISECLPMQLLNVYVIRQPKYFYLLYAIFKPFIEESMRKKIFICGYNFQPLLDNIGADCLPEDLDGVKEMTSANRWMKILFKSKTLANLQLFGYELIDDTSTPENGKRNNNFGHRMC